MSFRSSTRMVASTEEAHTVVSELMEHIEEKLPQQCGLSVVEMVEGGALGQGTALPWRFDVDIIIYSKDINPKEVEQRGYDSQLEQIHQFFQTDEVLSRQYQHWATTSNALQFTYEGVEVDLLLSPFWARPGNLYKYLQHIQPEKRGRFSASAAKWQMLFFKQQPKQSNDLKREFIRRAKAWRGHAWPRSSGGKGRPKSYLLSLLVLRAYERAQRKLGVFSTMSPDTMAWQTTEELKSMILNHKTIDLYWEQCYSLRQYPSLVPPRPPRILDPANPANNLYLTGISSGGPYERASDYGPGDGDWSALTMHIHTLNLIKPVAYWQ